LIDNPIPPLKICDGKILEESTNWRIFSTVADSASIVTSRWDSFLLVDRVDFRRRNCLQWLSFDFESSCRETREYGISMYGANPSALLNACCEELYLNKYIFGHYHFV
jgi:hypothetical protein